MTQNKKIKLPFLDAHSSRRQEARSNSGQRSQSLLTSAATIEVRSPVLSVSNLRIERGGTVILDDVNWRVQRGEHWVILGANGSGKTSLLSALTGYLMPTSGEISVLGETYGESDWRELRKKIGLVSSSVRQMMADDEPAGETVASGKYAMIDFWGRVTRTEKAQALKLLRQVECEYLAERPWRVLSQGERQRVLIGRALMAKPRVLILDEPCAGLDPAAREHFLQFLQDRKPTKIKTSIRIGRMPLPFFSQGRIEIQSACSHRRLMAPKETCPRQGLEE